MTFLEKISTIERVDQLIRLKATGAPNDLANRLGVSRRCLFNIIKVMKEMEAPIKFCNSRQSYYYERECKLAFGFIENKKVLGGQNVKRIEINLSAKYTHSIPLYLNQIAI